MPLFMTAFVMGVEVVDDRLKTPFGVMIQAPFAVGEAIVSAVPIGIRDWKTFQIVTSVPIYLLLLLYFFLDESPRWLIASGKHNKALKVIKRYRNKTKPL